MEELPIQGLIQAKYSGALSDTQVYINLAIQTAAIVFGGIVLWRMSTVLHNRKMKNRSRKEYFNTSYSKGWKRK